MGRKRRRDEREFGLRKEPQESAAAYKARVDHAARLLNKPKRRRVKADK